MIVYLDVVFATNLVLDFAILMTTAKVRSCKPKVWRVAAASAIGASYVLFMFVPALSVFYTFVVKCLFSVVMIMTAFGYKNFMHFAGLLAAFYAVNAAAAGSIVGLHYMLQSSHDVWNGILFSQTGGYQYALGVSLWFILGVGMIALMVFRKVNAGARRKEIRKEFIAEVAVAIGGRSYECKGLIDTGNHLYDPISRTPVMVMEAAVWKDVFPEAWLRAIKAQEAERIVELLDDEGMDDDSSNHKEAFPWRDRIRLVPYRGINGSTRFMLAVKPDEVVIQQDGQRTEAVKVLIGIDGGTLSADGVYQAIIHPALVS